MLIRKVGIKTSCVLYSCILTKRSHIKSKKQWIAAILIILHNLNLLYVCITVWLVVHSHLYFSKMYKLLTRGSLLLLLFVFCAAFFCLMVRHTNAVIVVQWLFSWPGYLFKGVDVMFFCRLVGPEASSLENKTSYWTVKHVTHFHPLKTCCQLL